MVLRREVGNVVVVLQCGCCTLPFTECDWRITCMVWSSKESVHNTWQWTINSSVHHENKSRRVISLKLILIGYFTILVIHSSAQESPEIFLQNHISMATQILPIQQRRNQPLRRGALLLPREDRQHDMCIRKHHRIQHTRPCFISNKSREILFRVLSMRFRLDCRPVAFQFRWYRLKPLSVTQKYTEC